MAAYGHAVQELIDSFGRLPGIGPKSAQRIAFWLLNTDRDESRRLAEAISVAADKVRLCDQCFNLAEAELCQICADPGRDQTVLCVVEEPRDVVALERTREFKGRYHVLGGAIDHLQGVGPEKLKIAELLRRVTEDRISEVILCTNPNIEGEATAMYLTRLLEPAGITVSRIASGLPVGGDLEFADEVTLRRALEGRRHVGGARPEPRRRHLRSTCGSPKRCPSRTEAVATLPAMRHRQLVSSGSPWELTVGYSRAVRVDDRIFISGTAPQFPQGEDCPEDAGAQAKRCLEIIAGALTDAGAPIDDVTRTRIYLTDVADFEAVSRVHGEMFHDIRPANTCLVVAALLDPRWKVEIEAEAVTDSESSPMS